MEFKTTIEFDDPGYRIGYSDPVMLLGSCFAEEIAASLLKGKMKALENPFGVIYNPISVADSIDLLLEENLFSGEELQFYNGKFISFRHDTSFSSSSKTEMLKKINRDLKGAREFFSASRILIITFGTAWYYRWQETGEVVSNCHKIPDSKFSRELADPEYLKERWTGLTKRIFERFNEFRIIFTVSPVRHLKDGAHGNQLSKSTLLLLVNELVKSDSRIDYFPSYEIMMDELRDYRFYKDDMLHPSDMAVNYIWSRFRNLYLSETDSILHDEISKITTAMEHRIQTGDQQEVNRFADTMLGKIAKIKNKFNRIELDREIAYFNSLKKY